MNFGRHQRGYIAVHFIYPERIPEWISSMILMFFSISFFLPGDTVSIHGYHTLAAFGLTDVILGSIFGVLAAFRITALYINGAWKRTPMIRMVGAIAGAMIFMALAVGLSLPVVFEGMAPNTAWGTYLVLAGWDIYASYKAGYDARYAKYR